MAVTTTLKLEPRKGSTAAMFDRLASKAFVQQFMLFQAMRANQPIAQTTFGRQARVGVASTVQFKYNTAATSNFRDGLQTAGILSAQRLDSGKVSNRINLQGLDDPKLRTLHSASQRPVTSQELGAAQVNTNTPKPSFSGGKHNVEDFQAGPSAPTPGFPGA